MGVSIGPVLLDTPVILAPMSGVTDQPFRRLVKKLGAGLVVSEMIASSEMVRAARQSLRTSTDCAEEYPMAVQLAGHDPEVMAEAARLNVDRGAAIIDINFGCPVKKVVNKLAGSALMREEGLAARIMEAVVKAVPIPVTLKTRLGWDDSNRNAPRLARIAEESGIRMITIHGRTRCQLYNGTADWQAIQEVKQAITVPLIVNGDIGDFDDIDRALDHSGADGVMIGRGAQGRPWFIAQAMEYLRTGRRIPDPALADQQGIVLEHYEALLEHYGVEKGGRVARKHLAWYAKGLPGAAAFREGVNRTYDPEVVRDLVRRCYEPAIEAC
ncbi:tRNA dihydrouridine synthase DusB [Inquilinus sp. CAU 1745]|uniref:tRNA dihydrouridine synthase DusB n=1 Tax=Inquilinus sp. CAU 1745 TaxID=3140369 RepID=UPI00325C074B